MFDSFADVTLSACVHTGQAKKYAWIDLVGFEPATFISSPRFEGAKVLRRFSCEISQGDIRMRLQLVMNGLY